MNSTPQSPMSTTENARQGLAAHAARFDSAYQSDTSPLRKLHTILSAEGPFKDRQDLCQRGPYSKNKRIIMREFTIPYFAAVYPRIEFRDAMNVLFVGAGTGMDIKELGRYTTAAINIYGIDVSASYLEFAVANKTPGTLIRAAAERLPFADSSFDVILSCETIEHVTEPLSMLSEIQRVAKDGAQVFIGTPNGASWAAAHAVDRVHHLATGTRFRRGPVTDNHYRPDEVLDFVRRAAPRLVLRETVFDMPFYFACNGLPAALGGIIPTVVRITQPATTNLQLGRIFSDQAKYFFVVSKPESSPEAPVLACPDCHDPLGDAADVYRCSKCNTSFSKGPLFPDFLRPDSQVEGAPQSASKQRAGLLRAARRLAPRVKGTAARAATAAYNAALFTTYVTITSFGGRLLREQPGVETKGASL